MADEVTLRVWRGDQTGGELVEYTLPAQEGEVVLDVVHRVQSGPAPDLACRWNCKAGKCGSCSAEINGMPRLMCMTRMDTLPPGEPVTLTPMKAFPIIRDLVTDVSFNYEMARQVPAFEPEEPGPDGYRMMQIDVDRGQEFRKCIECFMCQDVCHVIRDHEENKAHYAGPRFFIRYMELESHPLDTRDRRRLIQQHMGLGYCNITKCCTEVCPEHIKITDNGIIPLKERVVDARYDPVAWLGRKILGRTVQPPTQLLPTPTTVHSPYQSAVGVPTPGSPAYVSGPPAPDVAAHAAAAETGATTTDGAGSAARADTYWGPPGDAASGKSAVVPDTVPHADPHPTAEAGATTDAPGHDPQIPPS